MRILLLNGPNLNLLGTRRPEIYGPTTLSELETAFEGWATSLDSSVEIFQSNHEGALIDRLHQARGHVDGIVFNPGAFTHTSYALHDAVEAVEIPTVEIHISNVEEREAWRRSSVISPAAVHRIYGRGIDGYRWALRFLVANHQNPSERVAYGDSPEQFAALRSGDDRLAILVHGGFWHHTWSYDTLELNAVDLAERGWSVANVEYRRLGNGGGWPVTRDDVLAGIRSSIEHLGHTGKTVLIGHSAGGQLALEAARQLGPEMTVVTMGGINDMVMAVEERLDDGAAIEYLGDAAPEHASPLVNPPSGNVVVAHGTADDRVPFEYARRYADANPATLLATDGGEHFRFLDPRDEMWTTIVDVIGRS